MAMLAEKSWSLWTLAQQEALKGPEDLMEMVCGKVRSGYQMKLDCQCLADIALTSVAHLVTNYAPSLQQHSNLPLRTNNTNTGNDSRYKHFARNINERRRECTCVC